MVWISRSMVEKLGNCGETLGRKITQYDQGGVVVFQCGPRLRLGSQLLSPTICYYPDIGFMDSE
ncbi:hypothetical protein B0H12DRAFT_1146282 [Mycena haematopus]|nr:hypothetical protein B0H12DRAFT_1146282 [Mycena haematopus]